MKKIEFELTDSLYNEALKPIRAKYDLIHLLVQTIKYIVCTPMLSQHRLDDSKKIIIYVDKMSRICYSMQDKIFSFHFPLSIRLNKDNTLQAIVFKDYFEIDNRISSLLISVFSSESFFNGAIDNIEDEMLEQLACNEWDDIDIFGIVALIKQLLLFEPGYLRYDHDLDRANGKIHPENHFDFFYSTANTMKLGLDNPIDCNWFLDMLNINTECRYLH